MKIIHFKINKIFIIIFLLVLINFIILLLFGFSFSPYSNNLNFFEIKKPANAQFESQISFLLSLAAISNLFLYFFFFIFHKFFKKIFFYNNKLKQKNPIIKRDFTTKKLLIIWFFASILLIYNAFPRLNLSLWTDEATSLRLYIHGFYNNQISSDQQILLPKFRKVSFCESLWRYDTPNNHFFFTQIARLIHKIWHFWQKNNSDYNIPLLRLISLIFAIMGIIVWSFLFYYIGFKKTALFLPFFLSFHPWLIRFSSEIRGYSLLFLLFPVYLFIIYLILSNYNKKLWVYFTIFQTCLIYTWPGLLISTLLINLLLLCYFLRENLRNVKIYNFLLYNMLCFTILNLLLTPTYFQFQYYMKFSILKTSMGFEYFFELLSKIFAGMEAKAFLFGPNIIKTSKISSFLDKEEFLGIKGTYIMLIFYLFSLVGFYHFFRNRKFFVLLITTFLSVIIIFLQCVNNKNYFWPWYFFYLSPIFWAAFISGVFFIFKFFKRKSLSISIIFLSIIIYIKLVHNRISIIKAHSLDPIKEVEKTTSAMSS